MECFLTVLMNQRMALPGRRGSVTFWAWTASIGVHLIVLTAFGLVKFSQSRVQVQQRPAPMANISQIEKLMQAMPKIPKPKIKKPTKSRVDDLTVGRLDASPFHRFAVSPTKPGLQDLGDLAKSTSSQGVFSLASSTNLAHRIEFFGSWTDQRKICYLVDCSGSMQGILGRVRKKLKESIQNLQQDEYFYIIFFGGDRLLEFGNGRLIRATEQTKSAAYDFIDSVRPAGQTNAMAAMERTVQIRDDSGFSPSIVYFLTDGFELTTEDAQKFSREIANLLKRFAPATRINTIGFWPASDDRKMLETIARQSGGEFVFVKDGDG